MSSMKVNSNNDPFSRSNSTRSRKSNVVLPKSSYSTPTPSSASRSPSLNYQCLVEPSPPPQSHHSSIVPKSPNLSEQKSPTYPRSPNERISNKSPKVHLSSPGRVEARSDRVFDFSNPTAGTPKSPRSPRSFKYDEDIIHADSSSNDSFNFDLQSPPKQRSSKLFSRKQYQLSKSDSSNSKSSLEYHSTKKHPTGAYEDIEYKVCHSLDSDSLSDFHEYSGCRYSLTSSIHSSLKEKKGSKPRCNIRTNPVYDEKYGSSKSINECNQPAQRPIQRCRKSTSDLTDLTDDAVNTTTTSLSRPSSPRRKGSVKGGLAYLASRRGSRDSLASNMSNVSNEDIGPLNFQNTARGRQRRTSNFLELPVPDHIRPRVCSLPEKAYNPRLSDDLYRLRTFSITNKGGVVNCGDSIINRRSRSNTSVNSTASSVSIDTHLNNVEKSESDTLGYFLLRNGLGDYRHAFQDYSPVSKIDGSFEPEGDLSRTIEGHKIIRFSTMPSLVSCPTEYRASNVSGERSPFEGSCCGSGYHTVDSTPLGSPEEIEVPKYRVVMLGDAGVGKTALVSQFMTSEYMNTYDASLDDEFGERTVSILLDGEESEMIFIDHPASEMSVENSLSTYEPHACVVIYSIVARASFQHAEETLNYLWREGYTQEKSVIVVGNKADLARSRVITANEGKALAVARDCKFIETSSGIQHNVDELLVGILKQIRLRESRDKKKKPKKEGNKLHGSKTSLSLNIAREILQKICMNDISKSKSCENLHVL